MTINTTIETFENNLANDILSGTAPPENLQAVFSSMFEPKVECSVCKKNGPMLKCAQCSTKLYCGRDCQKGDWKKHKKVCKKQSNNNK